jgi:UDP-glucose 4-epimerase
VTLVVGARSNLSRHLARGLPGEVRLVATADVLAGRLPSLLPAAPYRLVLNNFPPATALGDLGSPSRYVADAVDATALALEAVVGTACRQVVYTSSASVYGDNVCCHEDHPLSGGSLYAALKMANERLVATVCGDHDLPSTTVRLFNLYGGDDRFSVLSKVVARVRDGQPLVVTNAGRAVRDFVHVQEATRAYAAILRADAPAVVNVGSGVGTSVGMVLDAVALHGFALRTVPVQRTEISFSVADVSRLTALDPGLTFRPVVDHVLAELSADPAAAPVPVGPLTAPGSR